MLENPQVTRTTAHEAAVIPMTIRREQIADVMAPGIGELMSTVGAQGVEIAGPWYTRYLAMPPGEFDLEIGVPVSAPIASTGRVRPGQLPAARVARAVYRGPYEGLHTAWREFGEWIAASGHTPVTDMWERYVVGPDATPDPQHWRTELYQVLAD